MLGPALLLLFMPAFAPATSIEGPFVELSVEAAVAEAKRTDKLVMIDFFTTWCGPCKRLDRITWKDPAVVEWLGKHAVAMKIDAEKDVELAKRFKIVAYPTMVFINGAGKEVNRIRGFVDGPTFLKAVGAAGKDGLERAKEQLVGNERDPMARGNYADELVEREKYAEALVEYLWCWDEGAKASPSYSGVRRSFLLMDLKQLGKLHAPALQAMRDRRDAAEARLKSDPASYDDAADACALNRELSDGDRSVALYDDIRKHGRVSESVRRAFAWDVLEILARGRRYADVVDIVDDPVGYVDEQIALAVQIEGFEARSNLDARERAESRSVMRGIRVDKLMPVFEALVGVDRAEEAERTADKLIEFAGTDKTYAELVDAAARAKNVELARSLAEKGFAALPQSSQGRLRTAFYRLQEKK